MTLATAEPILTDDDSRFVVLPIRYPLLWDLYRRAVGSFWLPEELDLSTDVLEWRSALTAGERHAVSRVLAFFATADGIVAENLVERFAQEVKIPEARFFYGFQIAMENIHAETYAILLEKLITDAEQRYSLLHASRSVASIENKNMWAMKWIQRDGATFQERLVAFACVEGIFFSSSFAIIFWLKSRGLMPGLAQSNELIARDEGLHTQFACLLLLHLKDQPIQVLVQKIVREAVDIELTFVREMLSEGVLGVTICDMVTYVHFIADQLLRSLNCDPIFVVQNPFPFMANISRTSRTNFFERRNVDYRFPAQGSVDGEGELFPPGSFA